MHRGAALLLLIGLLASCGDGAPRDAVIMQAILTKSTQMKGFQVADQISCALTVQRGAAPTKVTALWSTVTPEGTPGTVLHRSEWILEPGSRYSAEGFGLSFEHTEPLPPGSYQVALHLNDKLDRTIPFDVSSPR